jgi:hypothetical protein
MRYNNSMRKPIPWAEHVRRPIDAVQLAAHCLRDPAVNGLSNQKRHTPLGQGPNRMPKDKKIPHWAIVHGPIHLSPV